MSAVPDCEIKIFGSFITGLYLPNSDIDIVYKQNSFYLQILKYSKTKQKKVIVKSGESNKVLYKKVADKILTYESIY